MNKKVSIVSPCYNGEKYLRPYLESVLNQTYSPIQLVFVDDGSSDSTADIFREYEPRFKDRGIEYEYIRQANAGQAAACNTGFKKCTGEYLKWVDSDDILEPSIVEEQVKFLETHPEYDIVYCQGIIVNWDEPDRPLGIIERKQPSGEDTLFMDLIDEKNIVYVPGVIMVRMSAFDSAIPDRHIFESREGQNWQILLPLAYRFRCGYMQRPLFKCVEHDDSHSRSARTYEQVLARIDGFEELMVRTVERMAIPEEQKILDHVRVKYDRRRLGVYSRNGDRERLEATYRKLKQAGGVNTHVRLVYLRGRIKLFDRLLKAAGR